MDTGAAVSRDASRLPCRLRHIAQPLQRAPSQGWADLRQGDARSNAPRPAPARRMCVFGSVRVYLWRSAGNAEVPTAQVRYHAGCSFRPNPSAACRARTPCSMPSPRSVTTPTRASMRSTKLPSVTRCSASRPPARPLSRMENSASTTTSGPTASMDCATRHPMAS